MLYRTTPYLNLEAHKTFLKKIKDPLWNLPSYIIFMSFTVFSYLSEENAFAASND